ncbi:MAG: hypothetical protein ACM3O2_00010 [Syntrophothermus sp.]
MDRHFKPVDPPAVRGTLAGPLAIFDGDLNPRWQPLERRGGMCVRAVDAFRPSRLGEARSFAIFLLQTGV